MQRWGSLGSVNAALVAAYFVTTWGREGLEAVTSRFYGLEHDATLTAAIFYRRLIVQAPGDLTAAAATLIGIKLVVASVFVAALVGYARTALAGLRPDNEAMDSGLTLAVAGIIVWILPALATSDVEAIRVCATEFLLLAGAAFALLAERGDEPRPARAPSAARGLARLAGARVVGPIAGLLRLDRSPTRRASR